MRTLPEILGEIFEEKLNGIVSMIDTLTDKVDRLTIEHERSMNEIRNLLE